MARSANMMPGRAARVARRRFVAGFAAASAALAALAALAAGLSRAQGQRQDVGFDSAAGAMLTPYEVDVATGSLTRRSTAELPAKVQYVWQHPSRPIPYATTASGDSFGPSNSNHVSTLAIGDRGELRITGEPRPLRQRRGPARLPGRDQGGEGLRAGRAGPTGLGQRLAAHERAAKARRC